MNYDTEAEESVVGSCLLSERAVETVARLLVPADFGSPNLGASFAAIVALHQSGGRVDTMTVLDRLKQDGTAWAESGTDLLAWQSSVPSFAHAAHYADIVSRYSARRALRKVGLDLLASTEDLTTDPGQLAEDVTARIAEIDSPSLAASPGDKSFDDFLAEPEDQLAPEVVRGLLTLDDRVVFVAPEGLGKSELTRQLVVLPAWGVHPFWFDSIPAVPTLLVDLENPRALLRRRLDYLNKTCQRFAKGERASGALWHRPGGIDIRRRADRVALEDVLRRRRPAIVGMGPVYKMFQRQGQESDEQAAAHVQAILDDLRTRFGFSLILEHHAPHGVGGVRELRPQGSSLWLRWPEFGLKLSPDKDAGKKILRFGRFREDRVEAEWPNEIHRGSPWPWEPRWENDSGF